MVRPDERRDTQRGRSVLLGLLIGALVGGGGACAGKGKGSRNPEACMMTCEEEKCGYDPNAIGNDEYLACLDKCASKCS